MANDSCSSAQTFCKINGQLVKDNLTISFPDIGNKGSKITTEWKQQIINILQTIHDYGNAGTRNPTTTEINKLDSIKAKQKIMTDDYNEIINILNGPVVNKKTRILGTYFSDLEKYIKNYKLNEDRCNTCNSGCNTTCQASAQCEDYCDSCNVSCDTACESMVCSGQGGECSPMYEGGSPCTAAEYCGSGVTG